MIEDTHGTPNIFIDNLGYLHSFYGSHTGQQKYSRSTNPYDISSWTALDNFADASTYAMTMQLSDNTIYNFYRQGGQGTKWSYKTSTNNGNTWANSNLNITNDTTSDFFYLKFYKQPNNDNIHVVGARVNDTNLLYDVYYFYRNASGVWLDIRNNTLTLPINLTVAKANLRVFNSNENVTSVPMIGVSSVGTPYLIFTSGNTTVDKYYHHFAKWNGSEWNVTKLDIWTDNYYDYQALDLRSDTNIDLFLVQSNLTTGHYGGNIQKWNSSDSGFNWINRGDLLNESITGKPYNQPQIVVNASNDLRLIFQEATSSYIKYNNKLFAYGDNGFITQNYSIANNAYNNLYLNYKFNELSGLTALDSSSNNQDGTLANISRYNDSNVLILPSNAYSLNANLFTLLTKGYDKTYMMMDYDCVVIGNRSNVNFTENYCENQNPLNYTKANSNVFRINTLVNGRYQVNVSMSPYSSCFNATSSTPQCTETTHPSGTCNLTMSTSGERVLCLEYQDTNKYIDSLGVTCTDVQYSTGDNSITLIISGDASCQVQTKFISTKLGSPYYITYNGLANGMNSIDNPIFTPGTWYLSNTLPPPPPLPERQYYSPAESMLFFVVCWMIIFGAIYTLIVNPAVGLLIVIIGASIAVMILRSVL